MSRITADIRLPAPTTLRTKLLAWKPWWFVAVFLLVGWFCRIQLERISGNLLIVLADRSLTQHKYAAALRWVDLATTLGIKHAPLLQKGGIIQSKLGSQVDALQWVASSSALANMDSAGYNDSALFYYLQGDMAAAQRAIDYAIQLMPNNAVIRYNAGLILITYGEKEEALAQFNEANFINNAWELPYLQKSLLYFSIGDYVRAEKNARLAIANKPTLRAGYLALIEALHKQSNRQTDLVVATTQALAAYPMDKTFLCYHALFLRDAGDTDAALPLFDRLFQTAVDPALRHRIIQELIELRRKDMS